MTAEGWELSLFLLVLTGLVLAVWNLQDAVLDWQALKRSGANGDKRIIAVSHVQRGIIRCCQLVSFMVFTVFQGLRPSPTTSDWLRMGSILLLYILVALPVQGAWWDLQTRRKLLKRHL